MFSVSLEKNLKNNIPKQSGLGLGRDKLFKNH